MDKCYEFTIEQIRRINQSLIDRVPNPLGLSQEWIEYCERFHWTREEINRAFADAQEALRRGE